LVRKVKKSEEEKRRDGGMRQAVVPEDGVWAWQLGERALAMGRRWKPTSDVRKEAPI